MLTQTPSRLLDASLEIRRMILKEALPPSNRAVQVILKKTAEGKVLTARKKSFWGLLSACYQLRADTLPLLRAGIILNIENDGSHHITIE